MARVVKLLSMSVDSAAHDRLDRAARSSLPPSRTLPGRGIVNSINMENGRKRIDDVLAARPPARRSRRRAHDR